MSVGVGDVVVPRPGTTWCSRDIGGQPLTVHQVHDYPASVGGPVYLANPPGCTPCSVDPHLQADQLEPPVKVYSALVNTTTKARSLLTADGEDWARQCYATAAATSLADFARKLVACGLEYPGNGKDPYATVVRNLRTYNGTEPTANVHDVAAATAAPDQVLITAMNGVGGPYLPYPSANHVLHPIVPPGKRTPEYLLLRLDQPEPGPFQVFVQGSGDFLGTIEPQQPDAPRPSYIARFPDYDAAYRICADRKDALRELLAYADGYGRNSGAPEEVIDL